MAFLLPVARRLEDDDALNRVAGVAVVDGRVDVGKVVFLDELVEGKLSCPVQRDELRDEDLRHGITHDDAHNRAAQNQGVVVNRGLCPRGTETYEPSLTTHVETLNQTVHDLH